MKKNIWLDGIMGVVVGDALGLPVQFLEREELKKYPVTEMSGYGTFNMPAGAWSDDGSMTLATLDSIRENDGIDYDDIMERFMGWHFNGEYTPTGVSYDQGDTCRDAICKYRDTTDYKTCGKRGEYANGNGALMRILPVCLYAYTKQKENAISLEQAMEYVHQATALTHNHIRVKMASGIYYFMVQAILDEKGTLIECLQKGMDRAKVYYRNDILNLVEWARYSRLENLSGFALTSEDEILSTGYVVDSLNAAVWSLVTTNSFEEALLKVVNLGGDTDTIAAIAGGLAGLYYGYNQIPEQWRNTIITKETIVLLCELMAD